MTITGILQRAQGHIPCAPAARKPSSMALELGVWFALLVVSNLHLVGLVHPQTLSFFPQAVAEGQYWRLFMHAWAHISWYHLMLDASAFLFLYQALDGLQRMARIGAVLTSLFGSVLVAWWAEPEIATLGLRGLSGVAHGLMAVVCLHRLSFTGRGSREFVAYGLVLAGLVAKCLLESLTGNALLASWHLGNVGTPIAVCHAGGLLGGLLFWIAHRIRIPALHSPRPHAM
ncbi:MAG: rhombosortase [Chthoniobacteraceae bacterium]